MKNILTGSVHAAAVTRVLAGIAVALFLLGLGQDSVSASSTVSIDFEVEYQSDQSSPDATGYSAFLLLQALPDPRPTATELQDPSGYYYSRLEAGDNYGFAQSTLFRGFDDLKYTLSQPGWTLRTDASTSSPTDYSFDVDASALQDFAATPTMIAPGTQGASFAANSQPTFKWSGPAGFDSITFSLYDSQFMTVEQVQVGPNTTSHMVGMPLAPGSYELQVEYFKDLKSSPPVTVSTPTNNDNGQAFADWGGVVNFEEYVGDFVSFSVVPEPTPVALLAVALVLAVVLRKHVGAV